MTLYVKTQTGDTYTISAFADSDSESVNAMLGKAVTLLKETSPEVQELLEKQNEAIKAAEIATQVAKFTDLTPVVEALAKRGYPSLEAFFAKALRVIGDYKPTR